jgi:hypothetical protein
MLTHDGAHEHLDAYVGQETAVTAKQGQNAQNSGIHECLSRGIPHSHRIVDVQLDEGKRCRNSQERSFVPIVKTTPPFLIVCSLR